MSFLVTATCPYCGNKFSLKISPFTRLPNPKFTSRREARTYEKECMNLRQRRKSCFVCPQCAKIIISIQGEFYKSEEVNETLYNKINCDDCGAVIDYRKCYKESGDGLGYKAYCSNCVWKEWKKRIIFIISILVVAYILLYWRTFTKLPNIRLW